MLIATAGHIDHGKTALVRALTGVETDRLLQEKARGISIDLGFAYWPAPGGRTIGFVDVPGHERYVRNMLAGVSGVGAALLVVAADDGVMPQTVEHVQILDLLGIATGWVALTKCDKVPDERIAAVRAEIAALLAPTTLADAPVFPVSAVTGAGIAALGEALRVAAGDPGPVSGRFRLAVDRCFTVAGAGTVVTGTVHAGRIALGDQLVLSPRGLPVRVRSLQSAGQDVAEARMGQRCAVGLAGVETADVHRGDWLVPASSHAPTARVDARIRVLAQRGAPLRHGATVHLHSGTASVPARVLLPRQAALQPGAEAMAALLPERPIVAANGDRFVLRDASGRELIGGGRILDPFPPARRKREGSREAVLAALERHDAAASLKALLAVPGHEPDAAGFARSFNLPADEEAALLALVEARAIGRPTPKLVSAARLGATADAVTQTLAAWHRDYPEQGGLTARELRGRLPQAVSAEVLTALLRELADGGRLEFAGPLLRLPGHAAAFGKAEVEAWRALLARIEDGVPRTISAAELATELRLSDAVARALLYRRRINGDLWAIDDSRYMLRGHVAALAASAAVLADDNPAGFTAADFRDATGIGRNHVIRILEFLDRIGVTARRGNARIVRQGHADITGAAEPWRA
ncbi:MAG: selenocysteine-specific translation elongation factor [Sphingomonadales bacterium]|nr:selenocysteine-specific translation elongation factor [Sphingomonadales bacterium]